jgi:SWI/SNF related-matrix-associated actin-dependent regulator of chromatin subfamily C
MLETVRAEMMKNNPTGAVQVVNQAGPHPFGTTGQGTMVSEVGSSSAQGDVGPVPDGSTLQLS